MYPASRAIQKICLKKRFILLGRLAAEFYASSQIIDLQQFLFIMKNEQKREIV